MTYNHVSDHYRQASRANLPASDEHVTDAVIHIEPYYPNDH